MECSRLIRERDPDVLEGHNIFRFDLEYLEARARRHRVPLTWGRDGSVLRGFPSRMQVAERTIGYRRYGVTGRHIVDTWILAQLYDVGARDLESYGLKDVARHFGIAAPDRTYLPPEEIPRIFLDDPARLMAYARDDVIETLGLSAILSPPYFVQAQMPAVRLPDHGAARQRDEDRRAADARVPPPAAGDPRPRARSRRGGRLHRHVPARGRARRAPRRRDLALSVADADPGPVPGLRPPRESPPRCCATCASSGSRPSGWPGRRPPPRTASSSTRSSRPSRSSSTPSTATSPSPRATGTTSTSPTR